MMHLPAHDCGSCRFLGQVVPWSFLIVASVISLLPLGENWQRGSAYLAVISLALLLGSYIVKRMTPGRRKF